ncbi:MAG TPA: serine hydrolase domain-containing protein, partial [Flavisolibacter sp.]|nr:serine hydrolase domain-containing protein [Flavisolibacter sp.]
MKRYRITVGFFFLINLLFTLFCFGQSGTANSYTAASFTDANRLAKIKAALPLIDKLYKEHAARNNFPGFVFGVVVDGQLIYSNAIGFTDINNKVPASSSAAFRIASMSKSFTAAAILKLRDEGKLALDDKASKYIPELTKAIYLTKDAPPITVRDLVTHSAGFPEDNPWGDRQLEDSDADLMQLIKKGVQFSNAPGIAYEYSNLGFALLGNIITKVSGQSYQQYITENILKPLGMNHTYWEYTKVPSAQLAHGYRKMGDGWKEEALLHDGAYGAMGGLITTIEDFAKYMALHEEAWPPSNDRENSVLKRSSLREMHQPWRFGSLNAQYKYSGTNRSCALASAYGYGLRWTKDCGGRTAVGHSGGLPGFGSNWMILPDYGIGVMCFANLTYASTTGINMQVLDTLINTAQLKPRQLLASPILKQRQRELVKLLPAWKGAEQSGIFAENFFLDYSIDTLQKEAADAFAKAGTIVKVHDVIAENNLRGSFILEGEKNKLLVSFTLTPENPPLIQEY